MILYQVRTGTSLPMGEGPEGEESLTPRQVNRLKERESWDAWWKLQDLSTKGSYFARTRYYVWRAFDAPVTWFRETIVEPLHDKYKQPFYHRRFARIPGIDECGVTDQVCIQEANEQYRLDKMTDHSIHEIMQGRLERCLEYYKKDLTKCGHLLEDAEEVELNMFIKYGEMGFQANVVDAYMKQKHRLIWERRHPEVMAERQRLYEEHKQKLAEGDYDHSFWKTDFVFQDKTHWGGLYPTSQHWRLSPDTYETPISNDWQYYKQKAQDPDFKSEEDKQIPVRYF